MFTQFRVAAARVSITAALVLTAAVAAGWKWGLPLH